MNWTRSVLTVAMLAVAGGGSLAAQEPPAKNPLEGNPDAIKYGLPNTEMPANPRMNDLETWQLLAYLRTLAAPAPTDPPRGNAQNGEKIFRANCAGCHRVNGAGGRLGPDLSRIGV